jgi:hypothetical protein
MLLPRVSGGKKELRDMQKGNILSKILAVAGTVLTGLPLLAPVLFSAIRFAQMGRFQLDYLMPAELFPVVLVGGGLLVWAALRAGLRRRLIAGSAGLAVAGLVFSQGLAVATGLGSGAIEAVGLWWGLVVALLAVYILATVGMAVGGVLLSRDLFRRVV